MENSAGPLGTALPGVTERQRAKNLLVLQLPSLWKPFFVSDLMGARKVLLGRTYLRASHAEERFEAQGARGPIWQYQDGGQCIRTAIGQRFDFLFTLL